MISRAGGNVEDLLKPLFLDGEKIQHHFSRAHFVDSELGNQNISKTHADKPLRLVSSILGVLEYGINILKT